MDGSISAALAGGSLAARANGDSFQHVALLYRGEAEYLAAVPAFVRAALARGDPVLVAVPCFRAEPVREVLGADAERVTFADMAEVGRNPGRIIPAVQAFAADYPGRRVAAVGEPAWPARSTAEFMEAARHEALSNLAFLGTPLTALCPYDATALPAEVLDAAAQTHPLLAGSGGPSASPAYLGPGIAPPRCLEPLPAPPAGTEALRYRADLRTVRELVSRHAIAAGLLPHRAADLVLAASELAGNTLRYTRDGGVMRVWRTADELVCEISDRGMVADPLAGRQMPACGGSGGHGLWLVHKVCDLVEMRTGRTGTTVRLHMCLPG